MCGKVVKEGDDQRILDNCSHTVHLNCFRRSAMDQLKQSFEVRCVMCDTKVDTREWRGHMLPEQIEEYDNYQTRKIMLEQGIVTCIAC